MRTRPSRGNVHNNPHHSTPRHLNASVEAWHYAPIPLSSALDKLAWHSSKEKA